MYRFIKIKEREIKKSLDEHAPMKRNRKIQESEMGNKNVATEK